MMRSRSCAPHVGWGDLTVRTATFEALMDTNAPKILIVDDNEDNRYTLQLFWRPTGILGSRLPRAGRWRSICLREKNSVWSCST